MNEIRKKHYLPVGFALILLVSILTTKEMPVTYLNDYINFFMTGLIPVFALVMIIKEKMGFNFALTVGAVAGQIGLILSLNMGLGGLVGLLIAALLALMTCIVFGFLQGVLLNNTKGIEMITSHFYKNAIVSLYSFGFIAILGKLIPLNDNLNQGGKLAYAIDLNGNIGFVLNQIKLPLFVISMVVSLGVIVLMTIKKIKNNPLLTALIFTFVTSACISFVNLPDKITSLRLVEVPVVYLLILLALAYLMTRVKLNRYETNQRRTYTLICQMAFVALAYIMTVQGSGILSTHGVYNFMSVDFIIALIIGGATYVSASYKQGLVGLLVYAGVKTVLYPQLQVVDMNLPIILNTIMFLSLLFYAFIKGKKESTTTN